MSEPGPPIRSGRWAALGVGVFLAGQYAAALWRLASRTGGMDSKFSKLAVEEHRLFLIGQNLWVLVAYALLGVAGWFLVVPLVSRFSHRGGRLFRTGVALAGAMVVHGFFMFRLAHTRPYFTGDAEFGSWYYRLLQMPPESLQPWIHGVLFEVLPWMILLGVGWWWVKRMKSRVRVVVVGFVAVSLAAGMAKRAWDVRQVASGGGDDGRWNVIVIGSDSLRGDRLGCMGYRPRRATGSGAAGVSPNIDAWAEGATVFERCWTPLASTLESGISMMTSTYPAHHGIRQMFPSREQVEEMREHVIPLAGLMRDRGYDTAAIGDWCAGYYEVTPLDFEEVEVSSFDNFRIYMSQAVIMAHFVVPLYFDNALGTSLFPQTRSFAQFVTPEVVTRRVEERLARQAKNGRPFFWHVFYSCNHLPYRSAEPYNRMFSDPNYEGANETGVDFDIDGFIGGTDLEDKWAALPPEEARQIRALYDGCTRQFDECFGRIMAAVERQGLADRTIVVVTADHGDDLYEPGVTLGHGLSFNGADHSYRVPLIIRAPGGAASRVGGQVRLLDLAPTLAELTGVERPGSWQGRSLAGWVMGRDSGPVELPFYGETQFPFIQFRVKGVERPPLPPMDELTMIDPDFGYQFVLRPEYRERLLEAKQRCLRTLDWKLVCTPTRDGGRHYELFHLPDDPDCRTDVAGSQPEVLHSMRLALERWMDTGSESGIAEIFPDGEAVRVEH